MGADYAFVVVLFLIVTCLLILFFREIRKISLMIFVKNKVSLNKTLDIS